VYTGIAATNGMENQMITAGIIFVLFSVGLAYDLKKDRYRGNGKLDKYPWEN
jgi:predicted Kef-type K+ transport protein